MLARRDILIRADADAQTGTGHIMRCISLGHAFQACGANVTFLTSCGSEALSRRLTRAGFRLIPMAERHPHPDDLRLTMQQLEGMASSHGKRPWLVLDGYHFNSDYQAAVRGGGHRVLVVDDTNHLSSYHADVLLNQNSGAEGLLYHCDPDTLLLQGNQYAMLRPEFATWKNWQREIPDVAHKILVSLGGSDPNNVTATVIRALHRMDLAEIEAVVVVGASNPNCAELQSMTRESNLQIRLERDVMNMAELMAWADLAVTAGGSTCLELAFMGLPSLALVLAENQQDGARRLDETGLITNMGWFHHVTETQIADELSALCVDSTLRKRRSLEGRKQIDGNGTDRIMSVISALDGTGLTENQPTLRLAAPRDEVQVWHLANDPLVRNNSFNTATIPLAEHRAWFKGKLDSPDTRFWVMDLSGVIVAQARFDRSGDDIATVSFSVSSAFRGKGLGTRILETTVERSCAELDVKVIEGYVLGNNEPSKRSFERAGFVRAEDGIVNGLRCCTFRRACTPRC